MQSCRHVEKRMMDIELLSLPPFNLCADDIAWVRRTRDSLSTEEKIRQLFVLAQFRDEPEEVTDLLRTRPGGVHRAWGSDAAMAWRTTRAVLDQSEIPPLITGDLEGGAYGHGCGTPLPNPMGIAAMNDKELARNVAQVMARESLAMGFDWSFTPVVDLNVRPESPIVGTRSYGDCVSSVREQALIHLEAMQGAGLACTAKHWPGEGFDARDQHLVTTVNPLSWAEWETHFGVLYRSLIEGGVLSVMAGHIAFPTGAKRQGAVGEREPYRPASLSRELNGILRNELNFNGVIVSDATAMAGFTTWADRAECVPQVIENGCDVFLFSWDAEADLKLMIRGLREGRLSEERVEAAVTRVLALKARQGLHKRSIDQRLPPLKDIQASLRTPVNLQVAEDAAQASVTLVKDTGVLPITPDHHRRVVIVSSADALRSTVDTQELFSEFYNGLTAAGFTWRAFDPEHWPTEENTDLVIYLMAKESMLSRGRLFLDWAQLHGDPRKAMRRFWPAIPTILVSFGHAAYLLDAPRVPVLVNAYTANSQTQRAVLERLMGQKAFTGKSPIDPFCGQPEARW